MTGTISVADPPPPPRMWDRGPGPPLPLLKLVKIDGRQTVLQVARVIGRPRTNFWIRYCISRFFLIQLCQVGRLAVVKSTKM